jgi:hypothetical protein
MAELDDVSNIEDARAGEDGDGSRRAYYKEFVKVGLSSRSQCTQ